MHSVSQEGPCTAGMLFSLFFIYETLQLLSLCKYPAALVLCRGMFGHAAGRVRVRPQRSGMGR